MTLTLQAVDVAGPTRWRWVLSAESGRVLADHQVDLDVSAGEYEAFCDLVGYLDRYRLPHDPVGSETAAIDRVSGWISEHVFGAALLAELSGAVRVVVPRGAEFLLSRPFELARVDGIPLARKQVSLIYEPAGVGGFGDKAEVTDRIRVLALFSMPARSSVLALRRERYELANTVRTIAAKSRKAIELRVLQYGVTRERLAEAAEEYPGWDVLHVSGHGQVGALLLEHGDGEPDPISTEELVDILVPARGRLKLAVLSACQSGAAEAATTLHTLGLDELAEQVVPQDGTPVNQVGLARGLVQALGVTALAMRYPVADGFAVALARELYPRLFGAGQPVDRAFALALPKAVGERPTAAVPAASIGTPMLVGAGTVGLRVAPPPGRVVLDPYAERMAWFPPEPTRFVGRTRALVAASAALAPRSGRTGVLFVGMVGAGKSACALELAHQHRGRFGALAWWQAPEQPDEFSQALISFATALETQLNLPMLAAVGSEAELRRYLPRLAALLREEAVLLVLDNVDTLLSDTASWRDPMWALLMDSLVSHGGLSRVVLTSRVTPAGLDSNQVVVLPTHSLSVAESVLLARELPHLGALLDNAPTGQRSTDQIATNLRLVRRVLNIAQGHPKLLELADLAAVEPDRLEQALDAAEAAGRDTPVAAFFTTGASALDGAQFMRLLATWTDTALSGLPAPARALVELLAQIEPDERRSWIVREVWHLVWPALHGEPVPSLDDALAQLVSAVLVEVEPVGGDGSTTQQAYRLHPGVGAAIRAGIDPAFGALVDEMTIRCLATVYEDAYTEERQGGSGSDIVWSGLAATPYLLRGGRWAEAVDMLDTATDRVLDPTTTGRALGYVRRLIERDEGVLDQPVVANLYAKLLSRSDPPAAEELFRRAARNSLAAGQYGHAATAVAECVRIHHDHGDLEQALELVGELRELTELAGYGPWTRVSDECLELDILTKMGKRHETADRAFALVELVDSLPDDTGEPERVTPVSVRGVVLSTALGAAVGFGDWHIALDICRRIEAGHVRRGASEHELARLRLNTATALIHLGAADAAETILRHCQAVFEDEEDITLLGTVFQLRAEVQEKLGRAGDALTLVQAGLRYSYQRPSPGELAAGHDAVARYLGLTDHPTQVYLVHRLAAVILRTAVAQAAGGATVLDGPDMRAYGPDLLPGSLDELVDAAERIPGVRLGLVLQTLVPDPVDRDELFDTVVARPRENLRIAQQAMADYSEERAAMIDAMHRIAEGERDLGVLEGLEDWSAELVMAFAGLQEKSKRRDRTMVVHGAPRLFGAQVVPPMIGHAGGVDLVAFADLGGDQVVVTADDESVRVWDPSSHRQLGAPVVTTDGRLWAAAVATRAGRPVVVTSSESNLDLWDLDTRRHIGSTRTPYRWRTQGAISAIACAVWRRQSVAVTGDYDKTVRLWDLDRRKLIGTPLAGHDSVIWAVAFGTVDGRLVALSGSDDTTVRVWDVARQEPVGILRGHRGAVRSVAIGTVDGRPVALSGGRDNTMRVWDLRTHEQIGEPFYDHADAVEAVAFGVLDGHAVAISAGDDRAVRLWNLDDNEQIGPPLTEGRIPLGITSVAFGQVDGRPIVLAGDKDATVRVWDLDAHRALGTDLPARFAAELPTTWTDPETGTTYDLAGPIVDDEGDQWDYVDFDGFDPILAEPGVRDVTFNARDVDDEYGLSSITTPPQGHQDLQPPW